MSTLDSINPISFMKIYCSCGRIVGLDRSEMMLKKSLGKELQCASCRNMRISEEIDEMDSHFNPNEDNEEIWSF